MSTWLEDVRKKEKPRVIIYIIVGRNATKVIELLVFDSHTHSKFTVKRHFIMCWRLVLLIGILKKNKPLSVFVFERKNRLRGFSVVRAVQLPHAEDKIMLVSSVSGRHKCDRWMVHTPEMPRSMRKCCVISCSICTLCQAHAEAKKTSFSGLLLSSLARDAFLIYNPAEQAVHEARCHGAIHHRSRLANF